MDGGLAGGGNAGGALPLFLCLVPPVATSSPLSPFLCFQVTKLLSNAKGRAQVGQGIMRVFMHGEVKDAAGTAVRMQLHIGQGESMCVFWGVWLGSMRS